jgi:O-glycosyl hydrolase
VTPKELTDAVVPVAATAAAAAAAVAAAGIDRAECAAKVKGICGTDPAAWASLLEGLAVLGFAFSLEELAKVAEPLAYDLAGIIAEAG